MPLSTSVLFVEKGREIGVLTRRGHGKIYRRNLQSIDRRPLQFMGPSSPINFELARWKMPRLSDMNRSPYKPESEPARTKQGDQPSRRRAKERGELVRSPAAVACRLHLSCWSKCDSPLRSSVKLIRLTH